MQTQGKTLPFFLTLLCKWGCDPVVSFSPRINSTAICPKNKFLQVLEGVTGLCKNSWLLQGEAEWPCFYLISWPHFFMALNHRLNKPRRWESLHLGVLIPVFPLHTSVSTAETAVISEAVPTVPYDILYTLYIIFI